MFERLIFTVLLTLLLSSTQGANSEVLFKEQDPSLVLGSRLVSSASDPTNSDTSLSPHTLYLPQKNHKPMSVNTTVALERIRSVLADPNVDPSVLSAAVWELGTLTLIKRCRVTDVCKESIDSFQLSLSVEFETPEVEDIIKTHDQTLLSVLFQLFSTAADDEHTDISTLNDLFLITTLQPEIGVNCIHIFMSDTSLSVLDTRLRSLESSTRTTSLYLLCSLINAAQDPVQITQLRTLALNHLLLFLDDKANLHLHLLKLAIYPADETTSDYIYALHSHLLRLLFEACSVTHLSGGRIYIERNAENRQQWIYKKAETVLILLHNFRDRGLNLILRYLGFSIRDIQHKVALALSQHESTLIRHGNPAHRNRSFLSEEGLSKFDTPLRHTLEMQFIICFLRESELQEQIPNGGIDNCVRKCGLI